MKNPDGRPDALIVTQSLSDLPKDIVKQQMLKEVLTDDFVFYYQESESYLSLKGSLKRIAFDHDLTLFDQLLSQALKAPAELALWKSYNGRLEDYMLVLERNMLTDLLTAVAKIAADDSQLTTHAEKAEGGGDKLTIYKLHYSNAKDLYFTGIKNRLVVFSHPDMPLPTEERIKKWTASSKGQTQARGVFLGMFDPVENLGKHSLYFTINFLSFGYQKFFPSMDAVRFRFSEHDGWSTQAMFHANMAQNLQDPGELWQAVPKSPSACVALPINSGNLNELLARIFKSKEADLKDFLASVQAPVAVCWYADSKLYTPLLVAKLGKSVKGDFLRGVFEQSVGNLEAGILTEAEMAQFREQQKRRAAGEKIEDPIKATQFEQAMAITEEKKKDGVIWSREVSSRFGLYDTDKSKHSKQMRSSKFFNVRMASWKGYLAFSPDDRLVDNAISVIDKKFPALSDSLPGNANSGIVFVPSELAELLKGATLDSLPAEQESVFRESVSRRLLPALDRMKKFSAMSVVWPKLESSSQARWEELKWQTLSSN